MIDPCFFNGASGSALNPSGRPRLFKAVAFLMILTVNTRSEAQSTSESPGTQEQPMAAPCDENSGTPVDATTVFEERSTMYTGGEYKKEEFRYRLMKPPEIQPGQTYPLVIFLHGAGERGTDNTLQLLYFPTQMAQPQWRNKFPCYLLAPQCRPDRKWMEVDWASPKDPVTPEQVSHQALAVEQMIQETLKNEPIDRSRVYLTGLSMGGFGSFDLAARHPDWFAAVAPICGAADPAKVIALRQTPVYIVHGDKDSVVPVQRSRSAVQALKAAGGTPVYVELPGVEHNSWTPGYSDPNGLVPWMFQQRKVEPK